MLTLLAHAAAAAQSLTSGALEAVVRDASGAPVNEVSITLTHASTGVSRSAVTARDGRFQAAFLAPGEYDLFVESFGYRPLRMEAVPVRSGRRASLALTLEEAAPPVDSIAVQRFSGVAGGGSEAGMRQWFSWELDALPEERRQLADLGRLSSASNEMLDTEGLPGALSGFLIDGMPSELARRPGAGAGAGRAPVPFGAVEQAALVTGEVDVESPGWAGGYLSGHSRRGTRDLRVHAFGAWAGGAEAAADGSAGGLWGGAQVSGPILRDTAHFVVGVESVSQDARALTPWVADRALHDRVVQVARDAYGVTLDGFGDAALPRTEQISGFARVDWQLAGAHNLSVRASGATYPGTESSTRRLSGIGEPPLEGRDISVAATLTSQLGPVLAQEVRAGFESSLRGSVEESGLPPSTVLVAGDLRLGPALAGRFERTAFRVSQTLHYPAGAHHIKGGIAVTLPRYDHTYATGAAGEFTFGSVEQFARGEGLFRQSTGPLPVARFSVPRYAAYLQDRWSPIGGLEVVLGARYELETLPSDEVSPNEAWFHRTGLTNERMPKTLGKLSPRFGFLWDVGARRRWLVQGVAGIYHSATDPHLLGELITNDGDLQVRAALGALGRWPAAPDAALSIGPTLSLLPSNYAAPRTSRASLGITRLIGAGTTLHLSGTYRRTDLLTRRADLNLASEATATDQFGREIHGRLVQDGELLAAAPGSNRRFSGFEMVSALNADGFSEYRGGTVALERRGERLSLLARYTLSRTVDNWLGASETRPQDQTAPTAAWTEGTSDLDVPHRAVVGAELRLPLGLRLSGLYRYRSGTPFTPGFRDGVDANADGSGRNDPAFVSEQVPGVSDLFGAWDCLREQTGGFAERNACRTAGVHALDGRVAFGIGGGDRYTASILIDALNLVHSEEGIADRALYLVDADAELTRGADGQVTVPLRTNPHFGRLLLERAAPRALRVGLQVNF